MTPGETALPVIDRLDRDRARLTLDRNVVVEAGAGTGKTTLLIDRALFSLLGRGLAVTEIVALTFTEKAAGEIRVRLGESLLQLLAFRQGRAVSTESRRRCESLLKDLADNFKVSPDRAETLAQKALEDLDKALIGTLHSFAALLLRAHPLEAKIDPGFVVDEGDFFEELFEAEWAAWLDVELGEQAPREVFWLEVLRLAPLEDLESLARALCGPRVPLARLPERPVGMKEWLLETALVLESEPSRQPASRGKIAGQMREAAVRLRALAEGGSGEPIASSLPRPLKLSASWPKGWSDETEALWEAARQIAQKASPEGEVLLRRAAELLLPFAERFRRLYAFRGRISFDGLLISARNLVRDHPRVREELKTRHRAFLVDEFQDTDPLQGELLVFLAERPGQSAEDWEKVELEPGKLFIVGDPKQSIYRFRGADLAAYERFVQRMGSQDSPAELCSLKANFRSTPEILSPVNETFERIMRYCEGSQPAYKPVYAGFDPPSLSKAAVEVVAVSMPEEKEGNLKASQQRQAEAEWIARWIEEHCREDPAASGSVRSSQYRFKDIAILLRTTTPLGQYIDVLKERGIPYVVEGEKYFYGTQEILDFVNLLRAVDDPRDRSAVAGLLRSPLAALNDAELYELAQGHGLDYMDEPRLSGGSAVRLRSFYEILRRMHHRRGRIPLGALVSDILRETCFLELAASAYHGQQTFANIQKLSRMASLHSETHGETLKGFIHRVSRFISEAREEGESPLADEQLDAVRILTVHKAKGLEYPVVFLPNLSGNSMGHGNKPALLLDASEAGAGLRLQTTVDGAGILYLEMMEKKREQDEAVRLFYVAMTRAKERLILMGSRDAKKGSLAGALGSDWPTFASGVAVTDVVWGETILKEKPPKFKMSNPQPPPDMEAAFQRGADRTRERDRLAALPRFVSPAALALVSGRDEFEPGESSHEEGEAARTFLSPASLVGRLCHKVLERWDYRSPGDLETALSAASLSIGLTGSRLDARSLVERSRTILSPFLRSPIAARLSEVEILGREVPLIFGQEGRIYRGAIDLLARRGGRLWIVDYKTDSIEPAEMLKKAERYFPQMRAYAQAVSRVYGVAEVDFSVVFLRWGKEVEGVWTAPS